MSDDRVSVCSIKWPGIQLAGKGTYKLFECLYTYPLVTEPKLNSLHLCEAPGTFVTALHHYLYITFPKNQIKWNWLASSLNPYYEGNSCDAMPIDDRILLHTYDRWLFLADFTGNIKSPTNIAYMQAECAKRLPDGIQLITADGSINAKEKVDVAEHQAASLIFAEIFSSLSLLSAGGNLVLKMFNTFEASSVSKLYLLACCFSKLHVIKPVCSRSHTSEVYVIALGYKPDTEQLQDILAVMRAHVGEEKLLPLFGRGFLPDNFLQQLETYAGLFIKAQKRSIQEDLRIYRLCTDPNTERLQKAVSREYSRRFPVKYLDLDFWFLPSTECGASMDMSKKINVFRLGLYNPNDFATLEVQLNQLKSILINLEEYAESRPICAVELQSSDIPSISLKAIHGDPVLELKSSLFVHIDVLILQQKVEKLLIESKKYWLLSDSRVMLGRSCLYLKVERLADFGAKGNSFFRRLGLAICQEKPREVCFFNVPILTHFAVSLLCYLASQVYKKLTIDLSIPDFRVTLSGEVKNEALPSLQRLLENHEENFHSLVDIPTLHKSDFRQKILPLNRALLLKNCKLMLLPTDSEYMS